MKRRNRIILIIVLIPIAILLGTIAQAAWWYAGFRERLRLADEHAPVVRRVLEAHWRFRVEAVESFTARNGCLLVVAEVPAGTADQLRAMVEATSPPVTVYYQIEEKPTTTQNAR